MSELPEESPQIADLFQGIKYFVSGNVQTKVEELLKAGGAERLNYFSDYVTHLIVGDNPEVNDISDANDLYEIPAISSKWVFMCCQLKSRINPKPYLYNPGKLFGNLVFVLSKPLEDRNALWAIITYYGGRLSVDLTPKCTHLITTDVTTPKYNRAANCEEISIVTPDWLTEAIKLKSLPDPKLFHPKLIQWPKRTPHESTTSITGFEAVEEPPVKVDEKPISDSTQALLEKLKQRMPWNQPLNTGEIVVPPNVVAPSFLAKTQRPQSNFVPIPRGIVHHAPAQSFNQTRMATTPAPVQPQRPMMRQQVPMHQQMMPQQRMGQNIGNRASGQQLTQQLVQQQLLQQQQQQQQRQHLLQQQQQQQQNQNQLITQQQQQQENQVGQHLNLNPQLLQLQQQQLQQLKLQQQQQLLQNQQKQQLLQQQQQNTNQSFLQQQSINQHLLSQQNQIFAAQKQQQLQQQFVGQNFVAQQQQQQQQQEATGLNSQQNQPDLSQQQQMLSQQQQQQNMVQQLGHQQQQSLMQQLTGQNQQTLVQQQQQVLAQNVVVPQQQQPPQTNLNLEPQPPQHFQQQQTNLVNQQLLLNQQQNAPRPPHLWQQNQQQQQQQQQQIIVRHPVNVVQQGARIQWSPNAQQANVVPQRQYIHLDEQTHNQLRKMPPEQQALFVQRLKNQRLIKHVQQRGGGGSHILIRGAVPAGLSTQQQVQWLQQQARQQGIVLPPNIQQQNITPGTLTQNPNVVQSPIGQAQQQQHAPGLSPINQTAAPPQFSDPNQQQQYQQLKQFRLQQLQLQREQAQKTHLVQQQQQQQQQVAQPPPPAALIRPIGQPQTADPNSVVATPPVVGPIVQEGAVVQHSKTKTALANMLSNKLQSGAGGASGMCARPEPLPEPSAACTLRLMTAQHNAALNSGARPQDLLTLHQRRVINGPNGEIIRPPGVVPQVPVSPQTEPPKLQYCPRPPVPLQHRPGPFYGHNPNLKLPPEMFLLGCVFVVVEVERYLDEISPGWQQKIEKHGGEVEKQYCTRVTHVLCETQRHGVVMQALRDCKRCVTIYWLSDILKRKQVLPPWAALHLPNMYLDTTPASKHLISLSGFVGQDRNRIRHMIIYTGAKFTTYFSKHNTILIAAKTEGPKYTYAKKWGIPVVNVQWLTDITLGNFAAMNQMDHQIYQQYASPANFSFDPKLVPNLMHSWKMPINISQEKYERVKRLAASEPVVACSKEKKRKLDHHQIDENENINSDVEMACGNYRILLSMVGDVEEMHRMIRELGGSVSNSHEDCTHLVMPTLARSHKLLFCLTRSVHILPDQWLRDSHQSKQFLPESIYHLDCKDFNSEYRCDLAQTLQTRARNKLFDGKFFWITPSVYPSKKVLGQLIQNCGGVVEKNRRSAAQIEATNINSPYSYVIVTHEQDLHLVADLLRNKKEKIRIVCNVEVVLSAILKQTFEVEPFTVKIL